MNNKTKTETKKPFYKKKWFIALSLLLIVAYIYPSDNVPDSKKVENNQTNKIKKENTTIEKKKEDKKESESNLLSKESFVENKLAVSIIKFDTLRAELNQFFSEMNADSMKNLGSKGFDKKLEELKNKFISFKEEINSLNTDSYSLNKKENKKVQKFKTNFLEACDYQIELLSINFDMLSVEEISKQTNELMSAFKLRQSIMVDLFLDLGGKLEMIE